jgi:hypothetical protein
MFDPFRYRVVSDLVDLLHITDVQVACHVFARGRVMALDPLLGDNCGVEPEPDLRRGQQHVLGLDVQCSQVAKQGGRLDFRASNLASVV